MGHTLPPWTSKYKMVTVFGNIDNNELAARLGSLSLFDRRGQIFWYDGFEAANIHWFTQAIGAGSAVALDATIALLGENSLKLTAGTANPSMTDIVKSLAYPAAGKYGVEAAITTNNDLDEITLALIYYNGESRYSVVIRYLPATEVLQYYDENANYVTFATSVKLKDGLDVFNLWKLVVDVEEEKYVRFILNGTTHDLSSYLPRKTASTAARYLHINIGIKNVSGTAESVHVDNVIVTQNEP